MTERRSSWTSANTSLTDISVNALALSGTNLFAGTAWNGVYLSTNDGTSWTSVNTGLTDTSVNALVISPNGAIGTNLFAGTDGGGVFLLTNNGASWTAVNSGLTNMAVNALAVTETYLFAGTSYGGVWRRPLSEMITSVERVSTDLPTNFSLSQNYPNPFNPVTTIQFSLPSKSFASLKIFDVLGKEVTILISEKLPAGEYSRQWNGAGLPSGVYFYRLQAGSITETKKLVLLR